MGPSEEINPRRPLPAAGLELATDVVQQPAECAVSMNFIGLNESGAADGLLMGAPATPTSRAVWDTRPTWGNGRVPARFRLKGQIYGSVDQAERVGPPRGA